MGKRIDVDHLGATRDVARGLGISRQRVGQIISDDADTPKPVTKIAEGTIPLYDLREWAAWAHRLGRTWDETAARKRTRDPDASAGDEE